MNVQVNQNERLIRPSAPAIRYTGRIDNSNPDAPFLIYVCSQVEFRVTGHVLRVFIENIHSFYENRLGVIINGVESAVLLESGAQVIDLSDRMTDGENHVLLFKRQDCCHALVLHGFAVAEDAELLPLPDVFSLTEYGLTLHYPIRRFETLSERAGTITFLWSELADMLDLSEDSVLTRLGVGKHLMLAADAKETLTAALSAGAFPSIPAALGDNVQGLIDTYQLLNDPDLAGDQRMISLEDGAFRNVYILTDNLTRKLDSSVAQSIRADRLMLLGLVTGSTTQDEWRQALGEPTRTVSVSAESAELRRLCAGQTDYYAWWSNATLCLHADEDGVLRTVMLMQAENGGEN